MHGRRLFFITDGLHSQKVQDGISLYDDRAVLSICILSTPYRMQCWDEFLIGRSHGHHHSKCLWKPVLKDLLDFPEDWDFSQLARAYCLFGHHQSGPYKATVVRAIHGTNAFPGVSGRESLPHIWAPFYDTSILSRCHNESFRDPEIMIAEFCDSGPHFLRVGRIPWIYYPNCLRLGLSFYQYTWSCW